MSRTQASGRIGTYMVSALLKTRKHNVTAITRPESTVEAAAGVTVKRVDYSSQDSLVSALQGQDALIITLGASSPNDKQNKLISAAAGAGVPWVFPNQ